MNRGINLEEALKLENAVFVDVRSPLEYKEDRIIKSINIPILDDKERKVVGTIYKKDGKESAVEKGLEFTSKKIKDLYLEFNSLSKSYKNIVVYCSRGGMRSGSVVNFFCNLGINMYQLRGGYKSYRNYVIDFLENIDENYKFIVLHGLTGVGKTDALKYLNKKGVKGLDLENIAKNCGSVFGHICFKDNPPSQKLFESLIFNYINNSKSKYIFIESESKRIGSVLIPNSIYNTMIEKGYHILLESSINSRVKRLVEQYISLNYKEDTVILDALEKLRKRLGNEKIDYLIEKLNSKEYAIIAKELIVNYYDPLYKYSIDKFAYNHIISCDKFEKAMAKLITIYERLERRELNK
ncbi:tRNA 2-selenouridine(34) synthase MnmH [Tepidibacter formicigenes]|uniref:tRNA 2-selenouridine synthase n=1 Tax=Tepidibacter formicigenes DSM 15518 TaxID=1123349 RepID=A0A1M6JDP9_9FIRM|nr:tRNA 2-selenouridine(34) synthase MnmH [Tepidibacter formicigenes]SHJ44813.1 tRNA 2-selenouridine synthase [Tepidibacter formicigenes DSM 15518]